MVCGCAVGADTSRGPVNSFSLHTLDQEAPALGLGAERTLADYRGQWVVLHFWATWCVPCVKELPGLDRLSQRWTDIAFFAVSTDEDGERSVPAFVTRTGVRLPILLYREARAPERYWSWGVPVTYFINPEGRLVARALGPRDWDTPAADELLARMTGGTVRKPAVMIQEGR
jgi:thiol-disulfide isomerase/thioredoxin